MAILKQKKVITTNYIDRFSCIGSQCEDDCCHGWGIRIDKEHYEKIKKVMSVGEAEKQIFKKNIKIIQGEKASVNTYAHFVLNEEVRCNFFNTEGLCSLQVSHGAEILPNICMVFPRKQFSIGNVFEVSASLSCPEMARLCLLEEDAMYLVEAEVDINDGLIATITQDSFYEKYYSDIRIAMVELLDPAKFTINQRLFMTVFFALETEEDFYKSLASDPGEKLQKHIENFSKMEIKNEIIRLSDEIVFSSANALKIILDLLVNVAATPVIMNTLKHGFFIDPNQTDSLDEKLDLAVIYAEHKERVTRVEAIYSKKLDQFFTNFCINYWLGEPYILSENLVVHSRKLLVRIACLRFMFFCHQNIIDLLKNDDISGQEGVLDKTAVEVFYQFSKMYEHNEAGMQKIEDDIIKGDYGLPLLATLIKF